MTPILVPVSTPLAPQPLVYQHTKSGTITSTPIHVGSGSVTSTPITPFHVSKETIGQLKNVLGKSTKVTTSSASKTPVLMNTLNAPPKSFNSNTNPVSTPPPPALVNPTALPNFSAMNVNTNSATSSDVKSETPDKNIPPPKLKAAPHASPEKMAAVPPTVMTPPTNGVDLNNAAKNGQLLTLPAAVAKRLNLAQPLALKINNMQITVPSSCFLHTSEGLKVFLPPKTFPVQIGETAKLSVTVTNDKSTSNNNTSISVKVGDGSSTALTNGVTKVTKSPPEKVTRKSRCAKLNINPGACLIKKLYGGADCMLEIFKYLNMQDLARYVVL